jgi:Tol biopolymer transport system component
LTNGTAVTRRVAAALLALAVLAMGDARAGGRVRPHPYDDDPAWSPNGRHVAFLRDEVLYVMNPDGSRLRKLPGAGLFSWSARGRLAFSRPDRDGSHLYTSRPDGSDLRQLTFGSVHDSRPAWSPDARSLLFVRTDERGRRDVWRVGADGSDPRRLTFDGHSYLSYLDRVWSPDGRRFVFVSCTGSKCGKQRNDIFVMRSTGGGRRRLTRSNDNNTPTWSPDGGLIAFFTAKDHELDATSNAEIDVMRPDGSGRRSITRPSAHELRLAGNATSMSWSPHGAWIVFDADSDLSYYGESALWVVARDGSGAHPLLPRDRRRGRFDQAPSWSADGRWITWVRLYPDRTSQGQLFGSVHAGRSDGTHLRRLTY